MTEKRSERDEPIRPRRPEGETRPNVPATPKIRDREENDAKATAGARWKQEKADERNAVATADSTGQGANRVDERSDEGSPLTSSDVGDQTLPTHSERVHD